MTSLKTVLLGSAASFLAVGVAQAADLPVKKAAAAVQYVETCPVYGSGFYKLPGTDICIRHFGSMKFNFAFQNARSIYDLEDKQRTDSNVANTAGWQWTIRPGWDFRSPTEFGTMRWVVQMRVDQRNGVHENSAPVMTGSMRTSNIIHRGYIEWAGFIIGRAASQFPYWDQDDVVTAIGGDPKTTAMQFTYVWNFGGGLKLTVGAEDTTPWLAHNGLKDMSGTCPNPEATVTSNVGNHCNGVAKNSDGDILLGPQRWAYDFVASLSTEQAWGNAKIAGAMHRLQWNSSRNGHLIDTYAPNGGIDDFADYPTNLKGSTWGYAGLAGITFNLPMLGAKDQLLLQGTWCNGAIAYCGINGGADNNSSSFERSGQYLNGITRDDEDGYIRSVGSGFTIEKTKAWSVAAQLRHYWTPMWRTNIMGSYRKINVSDWVCKNADAPYGSEANSSGSDHGQCDAKAWDAAINLIWGQSRKTAEIGVEFAYKKLTQDKTPGNAGNDTDDTGGRDLSHGNRSPSGWVVSAFISRAW